MIKEHDWHFEETDQFEAITDDEEKLFDKVKVLCHKDYVAMDKTLFENDNKDGMIIGVGLLSVQDDATRVYYLKGTGKAGHSDIWASGWDRSKALPGFITNTGIFLTRFQAGRLHESFLYQLLPSEDLARLKKEHKSPGRDLYSYDVDWNFQQEFLVRA